MICWSSLKSPEWWKEDFVTAICLVWNGCNFADSQRKVKDLSFGKQKTIHFTWSTNCLRFLSCCDGIPRTVLTVSSGSTIVTSSVAKWNHRIDSCTVLFFSPLNNQTLWAKAFEHQFRAASPLKSFDFRLQNVVLNYLLVRRSHCCEHQWDLTRNPEVNQSKTPPSMMFSVVYRAIASEYTVLERLILLNNLPEDSLSELSTS